VKSVLFVCVENACRSQMAEGFARVIADFPLRVASGGTKPAPAVDPNAVAVMAEVGIDISGHTPKPIQLDEVGDYDYVITMGCGVEGICPAGFIGTSIDWNIPDPKGKGISEFRRVRDLIRDKVEELLERIVKEEQ